MKKTFLLSLLIGCSSIVSAAESKLFTGEVATESFSRMDMISWAMGEILSDGRYVNFGTEASPAFTRITDNPDKTGLNKTEKTLQLTSLKGKSWWPDFLNLDLAEPITITDANRYLHFYHYRENLNKGFSVNINGDGTPLGDTDKGTKRFDLDLAKAGTWEDVVVDLKWFRDNAEAFSRICILMDRNWGGEAEPVTNYYIDEIALTSDPLPRGINILADTEMSLYMGNETSYNKWVSKLDLQNSENTSEIVANPFTTELATLNATKVMKFSKSANASWWQGGPRIVFPGIYQVGKNDPKAFLHVMVNIPQMEAGMDYYAVQLNAKDYAGNQLTSSLDNNKYWSDYAGTWMDCVLDVASLGYVAEFSVRFDVRKNSTDAYINSPAGVFYLDAVTINNTEEQRTAVNVPAGVKTAKTDNIKIFTTGSVINVIGEASEIEVYNSVGTLVNKVKATGANTQLAVSQSGVYFVKVVGLDGSEQNAKVLVK